MAWNRIRATVRGLPLLMAMFLTGCDGGGGAPVGQESVSDGSCVLADCGRFEKHDYTAFKPENAADSAPWLILLHGASTSSEYTLVQWSALQFATANGYVLVIPRSISAFWNLDADAEFLPRLIDHLQSRYGAPRSVFVAGWSSGSVQSQVLACRHPEVISGVISLAGELYANDAPECVPSRPVGVALIHGTSDSVVPIGGSSFGTLSLDEAYAHWRDRNGCTGGNATGPSVSLEHNLVSHTTTAEDCLAPVQSTVTTNGEHQTAFDAAVLHPFMLDFFERTMVARGE